MVTWPSNLPQEFNVGEFNIEPPNNIVNTTVDAGVPKRRRRFTKGVQVVSGKMVMDLDQYRTLMNFMDVDLHDGVDQFYFPRPGYCLGSIVASFKEGIKKDHIGGDHFQISFSLETLDNYVE